MQGLQNIVKNRENPEITNPTLIMTGEFDIELAKKMAEEWHIDHNNSAYFMIENAGHCANIDQPEVFNKKVKAFIDNYN